MRRPFLLFIIYSREVRLFASVVALESHIETVDVLNEEFRAFDYNGIELELTVDSYGAPRARPMGAKDNAMRDLILEYYHENPVFNDRKTTAELISLFAGAYRYPIENLGTETC
jgi:hypothetical protein